MAGIDEGSTVVSWLLWKPISPANAGLASILMTVVAEVIGRGSPAGFAASTRSVNGRCTLSDPFSQVTAGVPNRAPLKVGSFVPRVAVTTATVPAAAQEKSRAPWNPAC